MRMWFQLLAGLLLLAGQSVVLADSPLAWKFTSGETHTYRLTQSALVTHGSAETRQTVAEVGQRLDFTWTVKETHEDGSATIALKVTELSMQLKGPGGQEVAYDLADKDPQGYAAMLWPMGMQLAEAEVTVSMSPTGEVKLLDLPAELADAIKGVPKAKKYPAASGLATFTTLARLGGPLKMPDARHPTWDATAKLELPPWGKQQATYHYRLQESQSAERVTFEQELELAAESNPDVSWKLQQGKSAGTIQFDRTAGRPTAASLSFQAEVVPLGKSAEPMLLETRLEIGEVVDVAP
jgi:hypothetical protein